jgi:hypothetical protein
MKKAKQDPQIVATTVRIPIKLWEGINHLAVDKHTTMTELILLSMSEYVKREGKGGN